MLAVIWRSSFSNVGAFADLPRGGSQRFLAHPPRPRRRDHAHAQNALGGAQEIDAARDRPPAVAGLLEETETLQPALLPEGRRIAIKPSARDLESQQRQPVLEPIQ